MIATIAVIAAIAEKKRFSDRSDHIRNHSLAIAATTIPEIEKVPSQRLLSLRSPESGFHMIAAIAEFFLSDILQRQQSLRQKTFHPSDCCRCHRCDRCNRWRVVSIWSLWLLRSLNFFSAIAAITAIIWKPGFTVTNRWKDLQQARRKAGRFTRRKGLRRSFTLGYLGLSLQQRLHAQHTFLNSSLPPINAWLRRAVQPNFTFYRERKQKKTNFSPSLFLPLEIVLRYLCWREFVYINLAQLANWNNGPKVSKNA